MSTAQVSRGSYSHMFGSNRQRKPLTSSSVTTNNSPNVAEQIPDSIQVKFKRDYDIHSVDILVKKKLKNEVLSLPDMMLALQVYNLQILKCSAIVEYDSIQNKINDTIKKIHEIQSGLRISNYVARSKHFLDAYDTIPKPVVLFGSTDQDIMSEDDEIRCKIILQYLEVAKEYYSIEVTRESHIGISTKCRRCGRDFRDMELANDEYQSCPCGADIYISKLGSSMDGGVIKPARSNKDYCNETNFEKAFDRWIGHKKNITYNLDALCIALNAHFVTIKGMKDMSYYKALPADRYGKKPGTSVKILLSGLKEIGCPRQYEDYNIIGKHLWGWVLREDLKDLKERIMSDYRATQAVYESIPIERRCRTSAISTQLRLCFHLTMRSVLCRVEDFKIPIQPETRRNQEELLREMCEGAGDPNIFFVSIIP